MDSRIFILFREVNFVIIIYYVVHLILDLVIGSSFRLASLSFDMPSNFEHLLSFWHHKILWSHRAPFPHHAHLCLIPEIDHFSEEFWFILLKKSIWKPRSIFLHDKTYCLKSAFIGLLTVVGLNLKLHHRNILSWGIYINMIAVSTHFLEFSSVRVNSRVSWIVTFTNEKLESLPGVTD